MVANECDFSIICIKLILWLTKHEDLNPWEENNQEKTKRFKKKNTQEMVNNWRQYMEAKGESEHGMTKDLKLWGTRWSPSPTQITYYKPLNSWRCKSHKKKNKLVLFLSYHSRPRWMEIQGQAGQGGRCRTIDRRGPSVPNQHRPPSPLLEPHLPSPVTPESTPSLSHPTPCHFSFVPGEGRNRGGGVAVPGSDWQAAGA